MMTKTNQNFTMRSGDNRTLEFTVYESDGVTRKDITGATIKWEAALFSDADEFAPWTGSPLIQKVTGGSGITIIDGPNGRCDVALLPVDTDSLKGLYFHELEVNLSGVISTAASGIITIHGDLIT